MTDKPRGKSPQNPRETWRFRRGEFQGHRFVDLRGFVREDCNEPICQERANRDPLPGA